MIRIVLAGLVLLITSEAGWLRQLEARIILADSDSAWLDQTDDNSSEMPPGNTYYVATDGNDQNAGTLEAPFRTIQHAVNLADAGDTVLVRGGVYRENVDIRKSGVEGRPIRVVAYEGEQPVLDGEYELPVGPSDGCNDQVQPPICFVFKPLVTITGSYVDFSGFRVTRSRGRGIGVAGRNNNRPHHIKIQNCEVHEVRNAGIHILYSDHVLVEGCDVTHAGNYASSDLETMNLGWPVIVNTPNSTHVTIRKSFIHENWGEGVAASVDSQFITIEDNEIYDNYALQVYVHRSQQVSVQRNLIYHTNAESFQRGGEPSHCVVLNNEADRRGELTVKFVTVVNNVIIGCLANVAIWGSQGTGAPIEIVTIAHNVLVNAHANADDRNAHAILVLSAANIRNIRVSDNIILQDNQRMGFAPDNPQLIFAKNFWSRTPPATLQGPGDMIGDPQLTDPYQNLIAGAVHVEWYLPQPQSPALAHGSGPFEYLNNPLILPVIGFLPMISAKR
jgi:hypothetical protein